MIFHQFVAPSLPTLRCKQFIFTLLLCILSTSSSRAQQPTTAIADRAEGQPTIHFSASPRWMNDPNGPIFLDGNYHTFFQYNPYGDQWGHMSWGHAVSRDLLHWKQLPVALAEENGTMIFSGASVLDRHNTSGLCGTSSRCLVALYTGFSKDQHGAEHQNQNLAFSLDSGTTWKKYSANPVLDLGLKDFRDPKIIWHAATHSWVMLISLPDQHKLQIYRSPNLIHWTLASEFGPAGAIGGVWECPDLLHLEVKDASGHRIGRRWLLSVNLNPGGIAGGSGNQYFVGQFDGYKFVADHPQAAPQWADWGKDFYASTSFANLSAGQQPLWIAWMSNWQYASELPSLPGRGQLTLARRLSLRQTKIDDGPEQLVLVQQPVLPLPPHKSIAALASLQQANSRLAADATKHEVYLLRATLEPGKATEIGVRLRRSASNPDESAQQETVVGIDLARGQIFVDRSRSSVSALLSSFLTRTVAQLKHPHATQFSIEIVVDHNSVEVFAEDGETVLTNLIYPNAESHGLAFYAEGTAADQEAAHVHAVDFIPLDDSGK